MNNNKESKTYIFANWGEQVDVIDNVGRHFKGVITEFDTTDERNTKVVYKSGGFDWYNRDEIEETMKTLEQVRIDLEKEVNEQIN